MAMQSQVSAKNSLLLVRVLRQQSRYAICSRSRQSQCSLTLTDPVVQNNDSLIIAY